MIKPRPSNLEDQLIESWQLLAVDRYIGSGEPGERLWAVIVAGQPSAGKSVVVESLRAGLSEEQPYVLIDPSELEALHPARPVVLQSREFDALDSLRDDSAELASELLDLAVEGRRNLVLACSFDGEAAAEGLVTWLHECGYGIQIIGLAVSPTDSRRDFLRRQHTTGIPETAPPDTGFHDSMWDGYVEAVSWLERSDACELTLMSRQGTVLAETGGDSSRSSESCSALLTLLEADYDKESSPADSGSRSEQSHRSEGEPSMHPRFQSRMPQSADAASDKAELVVPRINYADMPDRERSLVEKRLQFVQTLQRLAEAEQYGGI